MPKQSRSAPTSTEGLADRVVSGPRIPEGLGGDNVNGGMAMNDPRAFTTPMRTETTIDEDGNMLPWYLDGVAFGARLLMYDASVSDRRSFAACAPTASISSA